MAGSWSNTAVSLIVLVEQISGYSGIFGYSPAPGAGNLVFSVAARAGTDPYGNSYVAGVGVYGPAANGGEVVARDSAGNTATLAGNIGGGGLLSALPGLAFQPVINTGDPAVVGALDDGGGNLFTLLTSPSPVVGGTPGTDYAQISMTGPYNGGKPNITFSADAPGATVDLNGTEFNSDGTITQYAFDSFTTFTPTVGNGGTATFSTRTGWYVKIGKMVYVNIGLVVNAAGSGAGIVTVTVPSAVDRTIRQTLNMHCESVGPGGSHIGNGNCVFFTSGTGAVADRLRQSSNGATNADANILGSDLLAGGIITIEGWYREA